MPAPFAAPTPTGTAPPETGPSRPHPTGGFDADGGFDAAEGRHDLDDLDERLLPPDVVAVLRRVAPHPHFTASAERQAPGNSAEAPGTADPRPWRGRPTAARLAGIARALATDAAALPSWDAGAHAVRLAADTWHEAWLLHWPVGHTTGTHDHAGASAALCVARGRLDLRTRRGEGAGTAVQLLPGTVHVIGSSDVHEMRNLGHEPALSVHVYAPRRTLRTIGGTAYALG